MAFINPFKEKAVRREPFYQVIMNDLIRLGVIQGNAEIKIERAQDIINLLEARKPAETPPAPPAPAPTGPVGATGEPGVAGHDGVPCNEGECGCYGAEELECTGPANTEGALPPEEIED